jgi:hypothetical protein
MAKKLAVACRPHSLTRCARALDSSACSPTVAVLFQAINPPVINGVRKPRKPGGKWLLYSTRMGLQYSGSQVTRILERILPTPCDKRASGSSLPIHRHRISLTKAGPSLTRKRESTLPCNEVLLTSGRILSCSRHILSRRQAD